MLPRPVKRMVVSSSTSVGVASGRARTRRRTPSAPAWPGPRADCCRPWTSCSGWSTGWCASSRGRGCSAWRRWSCPPSCSCRTWPAASTRRRRARLWRSRRRERGRTWRRRVALPWWWTVSSCCSTGMREASGQESWPARRASTGVPVLPGGTTRSSMLRRRCRPACRKRGRTGETRDRGPS